MLDTGPGKLLTRREIHGRILRAIVAAALCIVGVVALGDSNVCCGCDPPEACGANYLCAYVVLSQLTGCCGIGSGQATCDGGQWCVRCNAGGACGCPMDQN